MLHAACILADYAGTVEVANRTEVRGRSTQPAQPNFPSVSLDLADTPSLRLGLSDRRWKYTLGYSATALLADAELGAGAAPQVLQTATLAATWHDRHVELGLEEDGQYGLVNTGYLLGGGGPASASTTPAPPATGVQALVAPQTITFGSSLTALTGRFQLERRWQLTTSVGYLMQGGLDGGSQAIMPFVRGPRAEAVLGYQATRRDIVETHAIGQHSDTSTSPCSALIVGIKAGEQCSPTSQAVQLNELWRHHVSRDTELSAGAGASFVQVRLNGDQPFTDQVYPFGIAGLMHTEKIEDQRTIVRFDVQVAPYLDYRTGVADERVQGTLLGEVPVRRVVYSGQIGIARSVGVAFIEPVTLFQALVQVEWHTTRVVSLGGGVRYAWQEQDTLGTYGGEMVFGFVTLHAPVGRF
jgi:hypothetical protein